MLGVNNAVEFLFSRSICQISLSLLLLPDSDSSAQIHKFQRNNISHPVGKTFHLTLNFNYESVIISIIVDFMGSLDGKAY